MPRFLALLVIGLLLVLGLVLLFSKAATALKGHSGTVGRILLVLAIAGAAFWLFGEGLLPRYFNP
ncbi:MAG: hypothetical protein JNM13_13760 [Hyphomicrobiaceae bacterium]|nr:hypothetical protein [Hyphomicrobiaceae bacterium]